MRPGEPPAAVHEVLLVEDDDATRELLRTHLCAFGLRLDTAGSVREFDAVFAPQRHDIVLLDLGLPDGDGLALCRRIRETSQTPVIIVTGRDAAVERIVGLELGADDYVTKPFDPRELVARIHAVLRRVAGGQATRQPPGPLAFRGWRLDPRTHELTAPDGSARPLSHAEFRLLWAFAASPGRTLTRDELMVAVRGRPLQAFERGVDNLVSRVRALLDEDPNNPRIIRTVRGRGYLFCAVDDTAVHDADKGVPSRH